MPVLVACDLAAINTLIPMCAFIMIANFIIVPGRVERYITLTTFAADSKIGTILKMATFEAIHIPALAAYHPVACVITCHCQGMFGSINLISAATTVAPMLLVIIADGARFMLYPGNRHAGSAAIVTSIRRVAACIMCAEAMNGLAAFRAGEPAFRLSVYASIDVPLTVGTPGSIIRVGEGAQDILKGRIAAFRADIVLVGVLLHRAEIQNLFAICTALPVHGGVMVDLRLGAVDGIQY